MSPRTSGPRRRVGWVWATIAIVLILAAAGAAWWLRPWEVEVLTAQTETTQAPVTAAVERTTLTSQVRLNAQLSYGRTAPLPGAAGTITALPAAGATVQTGQRVYEVDGGAVVLLRGARPFWRELSVESADGEDVRQLQQNLSDLGFYSGEVDGGFDWLTRQAVRDWQRSLGAEQTGVFSPSDVVVADAPSIRIAQVTARLGDAGTSPATYTETTLRATARLTAAQARELTTGTPVVVVLPDGTEIDTTLAGIDPGGQPADDGETAPPTATIEFADQEQVVAAGPVAVRVVIRAQDEQPAMLVVPVTALLATADGGYAVEVWDGERVTRTPVEIGLVADARAQVLRSGTQVDGTAGAVLRAGDLVVLAR